MIDVQITQLCIYESSKKISLIMLTISDFLDALDLLEQLVGLKLLGDELDLVLCVEELLLGLVQLGFQLVVGVLEVIEVNLWHDIGLFHLLGLSLTIVGLNRTRLAGDLFFPVLEQFLEFALVLLDDEILLEDGLNEQFLLLCSVLEFRMQMRLLFLQIRDIAFLFLEYLLYPLNIRLQSFELTGGLLDEFLVDGLQFLSKCDGKYILLLFSRGYVSLLLLRFSSLGRWLTGATMAVTVGLFLDWLRRVVVLPTL